MCNILDTLQLVLAIKQLEKKSLQGMTQSLLGLYLDKSSTLSNWEKGTLTKKQVEYACTDAWVSLQTYKSMIANRYWWGN